MPLILAAGNLLRKDDGIGPELLQRLRQETLPEGTTLRDIGTDGFSLIDLVQEADRVLLIDAVNMAQPVGTAKLFFPRDVKFICKGDALSTHGIGLADVINLMEGLNGALPKNLTIMGIQPKKLGHGNGLSVELQMRLDEYIGKIKTWVEEAA